MSDWPKSSLHDHPDIAAKVGLVVADYALLEYIMFVVYALVSRKEPDDAFSEFYTLHSVHKREKLTTDSMGHLDAPLQQAIKRSWKRFKAAANRRTEIAHCSFLSDGKTTVRLRLFGTEPRFEPMDESVFDRTFNQYRILGKDLGFLASELSPYPGAIHELLQRTALGRFRQTQLAMLGSQSSQVEYGAEGTIASLARLKLLEWALEKWRRQGTVPPDYEPPWVVEGLAPYEWAARFTR